MRITKLNGMLCFLLALTTSPSVSASTISATVQDHFRTTTRSVPVTTESCFVERVPVYASSHSNEPNLDQIIIGTAIGSAVGNAISNKDGVGTLGGIVGAHTALKNGSSRQEIVGYREQEKCEPRTSYNNERIREYSHSTLEFWLDGQRHSVRFTR